MKTKQTLPVLQELNIVPTNILRK